MSAEELQEFAEQLGVEAGFVETSALAGTGVPELAQALQQHIRWDDLPMVVETPALTAVKTEVLRLKEQHSDELPLVPIGAIPASGPWTRRPCSRAATASPSWTASATSSAACWLNQPSCFRDPDRYFTELFELVLALHGLAPGLPALKDLRAALRRDHRTS